MLLIKIRCQTIISEYKIKRNIVNEFMQSIQSRLPIFVLISSVLSAFGDVVVFIVRPAEKTLPGKFRKAVSVTHRVRGCVGEEISRHKSCPGLIYFIKSAVSIA